MLVLTRKNHESVVVGDASCVNHVLKVTILDVKGSKVRLGFEAHTDVSIQRWEVCQRAWASGKSGNDRPDRKETAVI